MSPERLQQIEALYNDALNLRSADRSAFLDHACGADSALRREVESLLEFERAETCLDKDAIEFAAESVAARGNDSLMGRMLGRYQLLSLVGRGGIGDVYCAVDSRLNRLVAVKILPPYMNESQEWLQRLTQEARTAAALSHPHICHLYDLGNDSGISYLVFEYLSGELLSERLAKGAVPLPDALSYAIQMADALVCAHEQGIIHCDLKPNNIMLTKSGLKLLDFGIAELRYPEKTAVVSPSAAHRPGTLAYMAPEQLNGDAPDARTDIFAFGLVTFQMLAGRPAFQGSSEAILTTSILKDNPPSVLQFLPQAPPALDLLLSRCLAKDPRERWQSIRDVLFILNWVASQGRSA